MNFVTVNAGDAAKMLGVDRTTVSRWIADGSLAGCGWKGIERTIPRSELERFSAVRESAEQRIYDANAAAGMLDTWWRQRYRAAFGELRKTMEALEAAVAVEPEIPIDQSDGQMAALQASIEAMERLKVTALVRPFVLEMVGDARQRRNGLG